VVTAPLLAVVDTEVLTRCTVVRVAFMVLDLSALSASD
jgi:hypothetical protein